MSSVIDVQAAIMVQLLGLLAGVPLFGGQVMEDSVAGILDAEDDDLPNQLIVLQEGDTVERERVPAGVKEEWTVNVVALGRGTDSAAALRAGRLAIKQALKGLKAGIQVDGLVAVSFPASTVRLPEPGRRWGYRVIPITFTYSQKL
ncbi:hypothetical protein [Pseudomonas panipatensis]|uniref:Uncharacterized protein n=1 Tax=Pseudomonas panipatensis TaxID=428992 RepID=A0A1G8CVI8_9PSED|nr:hypothetical protein [Pseudomonas panipatensis]SDH49488.1 hypothetical protein SAMN05216272_101791 [Pseudomonas panipatensis]SMP63332.1 hypothetical protein SAMN06295951_10651 [Pseudomonas panipatensis]